MAAATPHLPPNSRRLVLACHAALFAAVSAAPFFAAGSLATAAAIALAAAAPLVAVAPGLFRSSLFHCRLTAVLLVPYFCIAVMELVANPTARGLWALISGLALLELGALVGFIRRLQL